MNTRTPTARLAATAAALAATLASFALAGPAAAASVTISPLPGTPTATSRTQISFLGAAPGTLSRISVAGSASGRHRGRLRAYSSAVGESFLPSKPFAPGERVRVRARWRVAHGRTRRLSTSFTIAQPAVIALNEFPITPGTPADELRFFSQPTLHPPVLTVHQASARSAPGFLFTAPFFGPGQWGPTIYDNTGNLVWFRPVGPSDDAADFRTQTLRGKTVITWWQGRTVTFGYGLGEGLIADDHYRIIAKVKTGNGLQADEHEFKLTPQGSAYIIAYNPVLTSLANAGGPPSGIVLDCVLQQVDVRTGLVMWEWHSLGHVDVAESVSKLPGLATNAFDYFHLNSATADGHGNFLISARNTDALYELNAHTGKIVWRLGGKKSTFTLGPGVEFAFQHNALLLPNGEISLYDDEGSPPVKPPSRGEVIKLDTKAGTATLVAQFVRTPALLSLCCGNAQSLPGGNVMIGWGGLPNLTEFNAQGQMVFDAQLPRGDTSYRVYREAWSAQPAAPPAIAARTHAGTTAVYASWNGATDVASWQLLTGPSASHVTAVSTTPRSGFETVIPSPPAAFVQVRALSASGSVLSTSAAVAPAAG
jgi:outer membrane protein assembly factor BamB